MFFFFLSDNVRYVAVGLSADRSMGDDASMECVTDGGSIRAYSSWLTPRNNLGSTRQGIVSIRSFFFVLSLPCLKNVILCDGL